MTSINIKNATVSYLIRQVRPSKVSLSQGRVGGRISRYRRYVEITALDNVSLCLKKSDRIGLIGANGSGKTTLLYLCAGAIAAKQGTVEITGRVAPQFSMMAGIRQELSGRLNAELKSLYLGVSQHQIEEKIERIKELSGLGGYFELPVSSYSQGMRSRLVVSMLTLVEKDILVMDEWIGAADASLLTTTNSLQEELIERSDITIIASHSSAIVERWASKLIWLDAGKIRQFGPVNQVLDNYKNWVDSQEYK